MCRFHIKASSFAVLLSVLSWISSAAQLFPTPYGQSYFQAKAQASLFKSFHLLDGRFSLHFRQCRSMTVEVPSSKAFQSLLDDDLVQALSSTVQFDVCESANPLNCQPYISELNEFIQNAVEYPVDETTRYCQACQEAVDDCFWNDDANNRQLEHLNGWNNPHPFEYVNCQQCQEKNCFSSPEKTADSNDSLHFIKQMTACHKVEGFVWQGHELYSSYMCHENGPQLGIFLDSTCTVYNSALSLESLLTTSTPETSRKTSFNSVPKDTSMLTKAQRAQEWATQPFVQPLNCACIRYTSPSNEEIMALHSYEHDHSIWAMNPYCQDVLQSSLPCHAMASTRANTFPRHDHLLDLEHVHNIDQVCSVLQQTATTTQVKDNHHTSAVVILTWPLVVMMVVALLILLFLSFRSGRYQSFCRCRRVDMLPLTDTMLGSSEHKINIHSIE